MPEYNSKAQRTLLEPRYSGVVCPLSCRGKLTQACEDEGRGGSVGMASSGWNQCTWQNT